MDGFGEKPQTRAGFVSFGGFHLLGNEEEEEPGCAVHAEQS